jgi:hypothetical protein
LVEVHRSPVLAVAWLVVAAAIALWLSLQVDLQALRVGALALILGAFGLVVASIGTLRAATGRRGLSRWRALGLPAHDYAFAAVFAGLSGYGVAQLL